MSTSDPQNPWLLPRTGRGALQTLRWGGGTHVIPRGLKTGCPFPAGQERAHRGGEAKGEGAPTTAGSEDGTEGRGPRCTEPWQVQSPWLTAKGRDPGRLATGLCQRPCRARVDPRSKGALCVQFGGGPPTPTSWRHRDRQPRCHTRAGPDSGNAAHAAAKPGWVTPKRPWGRRRARGPSAGLVGGLVEGTWRGPAWAAGSG